MLEGFVSSEMNWRVEMLSRNGVSEREEFWRLAVNEWLSSGLTIRAFCKREQLSEPSFYAWRRKIELRDREPTAAIGEFISAVCAGGSDRRA